MKKILTFALAALVAALMSSCVFSSDKAPRIFVLTPLAQPGAAEGYPVVKISFINLPNHLRRIESVKMTNAGEVKFFNDWQWGDRLQDCIHTVLNRNLIQIMGIDNVCGYYSKTKQNAEVEVSVIFDVCSFSAEKNTLIMKGICLCQKNGKNDAMESLPFELTGSAEATPESIVKSYNELLCQLAEKLAEHLRSK